MLQLWDQVTDSNVNTPDSKQ